MAERVDDVTVLDVGTDVGYFPPLALDALAADARALAVDPNPGARRLLERNLALNGYRDRVTVDELAMSDRDGADSFYLSEATNWSKLGDPPSRFTGTTIDVDVRTGDSYLRERGVDPGEVNVVRMDVEGYELDILEGMSAVLGGESPLLLFVETRAELRDDGLAEFVELLERSGLNLERGSVSRTPDPAARSPTSTACTASRSPTRSPSSCSAAGADDRYTRSGSRRTTHHTIRGSVFIY